MSTSLTNPATLGKNQIFQWRAIILLEFCEIHFFRVKIPSLFLVKKSEFRKIRSKFLLEKSEFREMRVKLLRKTEKTEFSRETGVNGREEMYGGCVASGGR